MPFFCANTTPGLTNKKMLRFVILKIFYKFSKYMTIITVRYLQLRYFLLINDKLQHKTININSIEKKQTLLIIKQPD